MRAELPSQGSASWPRKKRQDLESYFRRTDTDDQVDGEL